MNKNYRKQVQYIPSLHNINMYAVAAPGRILQLPPTSQTTALNSTLPVNSIHEWTASWPSRPPFCLLHVVYPFVTAHQRVGRIQCHRESHVRLHSSVPESISIYRMKRIATKTSNTNHLGYYCTAIWPHQNMPIIKSTEGPLREARLNVFYPRSSRKKALNRPVTFSSREGSCCTKCNGSFHPMTRRVLVY